MMVKFSEYDEYTDTSRCCHVANKRCSCRRTTLAATNRCIIVLMVFLGSAWAVAADNTGIDLALFNCPQLKSQESLDLDGIMGKWYVVEVLDHKIEPTREMSTARVVIDSCPIIKIRPDERALLRLLWTEEAGDLEYTFQFPDSVRGPGYWVSTAPQNGTLAEKSYTQFAGTVHVMKAVGNHMVLTFCAVNPDSRQQLYSVLVSREHILRKNNIKGVHNLLSRRNLNIASIRETCAKGTAFATSATPARFLVLAVLSMRLLVHSWQ